MKAELIQSSPTSIDLVAQASRAHGRPVIKIFEEAGRDFYKISLDLPSPAVVHLNNLTSGKIHSAGENNEALLAQSFVG